MIVECESLRSNVKTGCVVYFLSAKEMSLKALVQIAKSLNINFQRKISVFVKVEGLKETKTVDLSALVQRYCVFVDSS